MKYGEMKRIAERLNSGASNVEHVPFNPDGRNAKKKDASIRSGACKYKLLAKLDSENKVFTITKKKEDV